VLGGRYDAPIANAVPEGAGRCQEKSSPALLERGVGGVWGLRSTGATALLR
jgi:hypothetical protein